MTIGFKDFLQIGIVADDLDARLKGNTSSSHAITTRARNPEPLGKLIENHSYPLPKEQTVWARHLSERDWRRRSRID
jgi:hypothetical protein